MDDITTLDVREAQPTNQTPRWLPGEPSKRDTHLLAAMLYEAQYGVRRRRQEQLDSGETDEAPVRTHGPRRWRCRRWTRASHPTPHTAPTRSSGLAMGTLRTA